MVLEIFRLYGMFTCQQSKLGMLCGQITLSETASLVSAYVKHQERERNTDGGAYTTWFCSCQGKFFTANKRSCFYCLMPHLLVVHLLILYTHTCVYRYHRYVRIGCCGMYNVCWQLRIGVIHILYTQVCIFPPVILTPMLRKRFLRQLAFLV